MSTSAPPLPAPPLQPGAARDLRMGDPAPKRPIVPDAWKNIAGYVAAVSLTLLLMTVTLELWRGDLTVPLWYDGDNLMGQMFVQNMLETGWFLDNDRLGAPYAQDLRDFPTADVLHFGAVKLLGCFSHNSAVVLNVFILLAFPLSALSSYFVCRRLKLCRLSAVTASVLYACAPYHMLRMRGHLFLSAYYLLPPMIWVILRLYMGRNPFSRTDPEGGKPRWRLLNWEAAGVVALCVLIGLGGVYYAFFSCFLLLMAGIRGAFRERRWALLAATLFFVLTIAGAVGAAVSPSLIHTLRYGKNANAATRGSFEADIYALNVSEMLLPAYEHRLPYLKGLRARFLAPPRAPTGEVWSAPLGFLASLGFVWLIALFLWRRGHRTERIDDGLAYLNFCAVALGTVGGLGSFFSFYISPMIRCYNRISIFIAFIALAGLFLALQRLAERRPGSVWAQRGFGLLLIGLLALGSFDQTTPSLLPSYKATKQEYEADADFGRRMEASLSPGAMVYEMPDYQFPEGRPVENLADYELLRPFLHTRTLRWSYGGMAGRDAGRWPTYLAAKPLPEQVDQLAYAGFQGIYVDRAGFADSGAAVEAKLAGLLGATPLISLTGRQVFFDMTAYSASLRDRFTEAEWTAQRDAALQPMAFRWGPAVGDPEQTQPGETSRWCGNNVYLFVANFTGRPRRVVYRMGYSGSQDAPSRLTLDGDLCRRQLSLSRERQHLELEVTVPPGEHYLSFTCDGPRPASPTDPHEKVFQIWNFEQHVED